MHAQVHADCNSHRFDQEVFSSINTYTGVLFGSNLDAYGTNTNLVMNVYEPAGDTMAARPLIIWAHGGSFISGTENDADVVSLSEHFAKRGYVCASISYRLGIPFPINQDNSLKAVYRAMQDMKAAIRFFRKDAATSNTYKIDPATIFVGGSSAGAFTALHTAYLDKYSELPIAVDTLTLGTLEGNSGNPGYSTSVNAVIDLCGALGNKNYVETGDVPFVAMHGDVDGTVPYATAVIYILGSFPVMVVDGSYSIAEYADSIGVYNEMYTYFGAGHVPYYGNTAYMDTTVRFVSNFLYKYLGCTPDSPLPLPNTFTTGVNTLAENDKLIISPNPGNGIFTLQSGSQSNLNYQLTVYDVNGRKIVDTMVKKNHTSLDLTSCKSGLYFYRLNSGNKIFTGKVIIQ
jgi:hypothetical protein